MLAFLLPYLALRTSESADTTSVVYKEDLPRIEGILGEFRALGLLMGTVGSGSILWSLFARSGDFGTRFDERYASFIDLLSIDRVGSSFIVDLGIFAIFQGWLVDDDMRRRGVNVDGEKMAGLRAVAKFVPFFGLAAYLSCHSQRHSLVRVVPTRQACPHPRERVPVPSDMRAPCPHRSLHLALQPLRPLSAVTSPLR